MKIPQLITLLCTLPLSIAHAEVKPHYNAEHTQLLKLENEGRTLTLNQPLFSVTLDGGKSIDSTEFTLLNNKQKDLHTLQHKASGLSCQWSTIIKPDTDYLRHNFTLKASKPIKIESFSPMLLPKEAFKPTGDVLGSPLASEHWFAAMEYPMAFTKVEAESRHKQGIRLERSLKAGDSISYSSVYGERAGKTMRRAFSAYLENERARPYKMFLNYNSWYDICYSNPRYNLTSDNCSRVMKEWHANLTKYGVQLDSYVFDDGWDDYENLWQFHKKRFPNGFTPQADLAKEYKTHIGVWFSPFGGYVKAKETRLKHAKPLGYEINGAGLSLAGEKYYALFLKQCRMMMKKYEVNYFKFDGLGGDNPAYLPDMDAAYRLMKTLRKDDPNVYINLTTGTWASPFFLLHGDSIWRGGGDVHQRGEGPPTQKWLNYRDGETYKNVVKRGSLFPLNSLMIIGPTYANRGSGKKYIDDSDEEFAMQAWSGFACGTQLQEFYISADRMNDAKWKSLAKSAKWGLKNQHILIDSHWIGGDPNKEENYGWASLSPDGKKAIICVRNPSAKDRTAEYSLSKILETFPGDWKVSASPFLPLGDKAKSSISEDKLELTLPAYKLMVIELTR